MKHMRKVFALALTLIMALALTVPAFAQNVNVGSGAGSITISNAAKGETYTIYKLFDATVNSTASAINYTGDIPSGLNAYFTKDTAGNIFATADAWVVKTIESVEVKEMSEGLREALTNWAKTATAVSSVESDGSVLTFDNLAYGYYVVTTTQGQQAITVDSTMPDVQIVDKNSTTPGGNLTKTANDKDVNIGDTVTYTVSFNGANYDGAGEDAKKIISYVIEDTLPDFLTNVTVTSIIVDDDHNATTTDDQHNITAQFNNKKITIDWYDEDNSKFLYDNNALVTITYRATVTDKVAIDGEGNKNEVTVKWITEGNTEPNEGDKVETSETIFSYAIALKKVNSEGVALADAEFRFPFYVQAELAADGKTYVAKKDTDGAYIYAGTTVGTGLVDTITTPADGVIVVKGVATGTYSITETKAPDGYNKLTDPVDVTAVKTEKTKTNTTFYLDADGNVTETQTEKVFTTVMADVAASAVVVVNQAGAELPSTGGIGTTIFYMVGGILMAGAAILLITKKKMSNEQ